MNIQTSEITGRTRDLILTEVMFFVASARSVSADIIKLKIKSEEGNPTLEKTLDEISRILRSLKRRGMIQLFVSSRDFNTNTTEIEYLLNKYPELPLELQDNYCYVVKL